MSSKQDAFNAEAAADDAVRAAQFANREAKEAADAKKAIDDRFPDPHTLMLRDLATQEQSAHLRIGPRRNKWRDLLEFEERLNMLEQRRAHLQEEIGALNLQLHDEPDRHTAALAEWMRDGEPGDRPASRVPELEAAIADRRAEHDACGRLVDETLHLRAEHVARNRDRFARDVRKAKAKESAAYLQAIAACEKARQELLGLRQTEVWVGLFPSELLANEPNTQAIAGAHKRVQEPLLPGIRSGLIATAIFELLREDTRFCESVATVEQYAALQGTTPDRLSGREARWAGDGKADFFGPRFDATWGGSPEEAEQARRVEAYNEAAKRRLDDEGWG